MTSRLSVLVSVLVLSVVSFVPASAAEDADEGSAAFAVRNLSAFGPDGGAVPAFVHELLPLEAFERPVTDALAAGHHYSAWVDVRGGASEALRLVNASDSQALVVISVIADDGSSRGNYLVHQQPGAIDGLRLDVEAASLVVLSLHPFDLSLLGKDNDRPVDVATPTRAMTEGAVRLEARNIDYCTGRGRTVSICNAANECVSAYAWKRPAPTQGKFDDAWGLNVQVGGASFHCMDVSDPSDPGPACYQYSYRTVRCDGSPFGHTWSGMDDTLFRGVTSVASCAYGCSGFWTVN